MKHFCAIAAVLAIASSAPAGVIYKIQSATTGVQGVTISGTVTVDGSHIRMDIATGDNTLFKDNDIVISNDGGRTIRQRRWPGELCASTRYPPSRRD